MATQRPLVVALVDDDAEVRVALMRLLSSAGFATESFSSGTEFLQSIGKHEQGPGCVVLDLHMPEVSGFEVQEQLLKCQPKMRVVVITGHDSAEARSRALSLGARAYLPKPVDDEALLLAIRGGLQR